ncbi:peptidoglycan DD-metalloendopeptidase family protein [Nonomuraea sp. NN258]|uniref:proprotein convertase P-domain-containing protein n=1 Tax=Nonomuraea antri TaxID=2730852 RepID=UPI0015680A87|nr:proprotein convertase P-domain-containing protein [Nonomuraea antri]NRQ39390.1 peptidoglycan DD-metalloendopeptidase family protein [Nonomuraea antri]
MRHRLRTVLGTLVLAASSLAATTTSAAPTLEQAVVSAMTDRSRADGSALAAAGAGTEVNVQRSTPSGDWVFGSSVIKAPNVDGAYPEGWLFVAQRVAGGWKVGLDGSAEFADLAGRAPSAVVSQGEKRTFAANAAAAAARAAAPAAQAAPTGLSLPYPVGASWRIIGGPHGWSGQPRPWSSIDLDSRAANREVLAAQSGRAYWVCSNGGHIRIIHDNGWTTEYYHLLNEIRPNGTQLQMGAYLGLTSTRVPCGGSAGSNHVHFALKSGSSWVALQDKTIGGWTYFEGSSAYGGGARRGATTRYTGDWIQNYGTETGGRTFENTANHDVADLGQAESPITVTGVPGNAPTTLGVYVDVHHGWRGDLRIDLIGPTGQTYRLRDPAPADDGTIIHENYTRDASGSPAEGTWRLRVTDVDANHSGYIDAWSLTF